ncbi:TIR domain-containing protein [Sphingomicrobium flavum]|uniref:TIR domain-containing protein n=1 Tax=Sphingomicrobium flavum TaxID=1229164 RepID=UPI0021ADB3BD|nr:TIR domain-containing protein [Sphingomicrobium flavum]
MLADHRRPVGLQTAALGADVENDNIRLDAFAIDQYAFVAHIDTRTTFDLTRLSHSVPASAKGLKPPYLCCPTLLMYFKFAVTVGRCCTGGYELADIFLSYAREDQPLVERLAAALEEAGYSVWWDRHLTGGHAFSDDIEAELTDAKVAVVAWSEKSAKSHWVRDEAADAREVGKLVPLTLDGSKPPMGFRQLHTIDLTGWPQRAEAIQPLLAAIAQQVGKEAQPPAATAPSPKSIAPIAIILTLALALIAAGTWWMMGRSDAPGDEAAATQERVASLAVMPFRDLSPDQDQQWFSDGLAEEITGALSRVPDLYVAASGDAFALRDDNLATNEIADRLRVDHVLGGSIRRSGEEMRITVELVKADNGERVWSQSYDRSTDDAIAVQEEIATEVARVLNTAVDPEALDKMTSTGTTSIAAYERFLRSGDPEGETAAEQHKRWSELIKEAQQLDPDWLHPYLFEASTRYYFMSEHTFGWIDKEAALSHSKLFEEAVRQILDRSEGTDDPVRMNQREAALLLLDRYHLRFDDALARAQRLVERNPNNENYWQELSLAARAVGEWDTVQRAAEKMVELKGPSGLALTNMRRYGDLQRGLPVARQAIEENEDGHALLRAGELLVLAGHLDEARSAYRLTEGRDDLPFPRESLAIDIACAEGDLEKMRELASANPRFERRVRWLLTGPSADNAEERPEIDRSEPPFMAAGWGYAADWNMTPYPKTRAALEKAGIPHSQPERNQLRCPGRYQGD